MSIYFVGGSEPEGRRSPWSDVMFLRRRRAEKKKITGPSNGTETTLLEVTSGAGIVDHVWLAIGPTNGASGPNFDNRIRVYTDGSSTPDIDQDAALFFGYGKANNTFAAGSISTDHFTAKCNGTSGTQSHGAIRLPIPFTNGVKITLANTTNSNVPNLWFQADYVLNADNPGMTIPPYRLKTSGHYNNGGQVTVAAGADATMHTLTGAGVLVAHSMAATSTTGVSYVEKQVALYIDGESTPSVMSSGLEDWFSDSWAWASATPYSRPHAMGFGMTTTTTPWPFSAVIDLLALHGGYPFTTGLVMKLQASEVANDLHPLTYADCLFYYLHT